MDPRLYFANYIIFSVSSKKEHQSADWCSFLE